MTDSDSTVSASQASSSGMESSHSSYSTIM